MRRFHHLLREDRGASAAEFALVAAILVTLLVGIVDGGLWLWMRNNAHKSMQVAARHAAVTGYVVAGLYEFKFTGSGEDDYGSGEQIPPGAVGPWECDTGDSDDPGDADCDGELGGEEVGANTDAFASILDSAKGLFPQLTAKNIRVRYEHVGLGYAGDPTGSDISPIVTVELIDDGDIPLFQPLILSPLIRGIRLGGISASMPMEDGVGDTSHSS